MADEDPGPPGEQGYGVEEGVVCCECPLVAVIFLTSDITAMKSSASTLDFLSRIAIFSLNFRGV